MKAKIKSISLQFFKGVKNATYTLDGNNAIILGENGAGKSTIATAYYFALANCDTELHNNPPIFPLDVEECVPTVRLQLEIDGKSVEVAKIQKRTVKKSKTGGADTVSLSNSYEVNSVEYGERDFKKKLSEYGFDFDLFLALSHPDVFTGQKAADMRKVLFGMASEKSDYEIACDTKEAQNVALLLENYTAEEVKAMQNATLRKIREDYGKDGEILRAKIEGMEQSKTDIDVAELELQKNALNEQIAENNAKQEDISKEFEEQQKASDGVIELKFELNDLQRKANEENNYKRSELENKILQKKFLVSKTQKTIEETERDTSETKKKVEQSSKRLSELRQLYTETQERVFDENSLICSYCGQELPDGRKEELKAKFEKNKQDELAEITNEGNRRKSDAETEKETLRTLDLELSEHKKSLEMLNNAIADLEKQLSELPESIDISDRPEAQEIQRKIAEKEAAMNKGNSAEEIRQKLKGEEYYFQSQLTEVEKQFALAQRNIEIDERIADLCKKQGEFEQNKANAEKILYQLDLVSRKKNELLTEDINKNFDIVKWQMFEYQKNGDYKDCCIPTIDGKRFGESTNTGREVLAKLDIIKGLQRFYGQSYPVFLDGSECLSDETAKRIEMDCQLILLKVTEDKELKIETEG
ncbi:MAG: AAA family ATPase [Lachnospiraceae bacterium]|nr:AAA family ATPase [Lachnospiraceae bacterium]